MVTEGVVSRDRWSGLSHNMAHVTKMTLAKKDVHCPSCETAPFGIALK